MSTEMDLDATIENLMDSPGGRLLQDVRKHIARRLPFLAGAFFFGLIVGYPIADYIVEWLASDAPLAPEGTDIAVLSPVEFIALKVRFAASVGMMLVAVVLLSDAAMGAARSSALRSRLAESEVKLPNPGPRLLLVMISIPLLALAGLAYAYGLLLPLLLDYLAQDAASAGLVTEWRLSAYLGFILNMALASMLGFQTPLLTLLVLRSGVMDRATLAQWRRHVWFGACVLGALLSPPDPLSLFLVAGPIGLLFEFALLVDAIIPQR